MNLKIFFIVYKKIDFIFNMIEYSFELGYYQVHFENGGLFFSLLDNQVYKKNP